ncbi:MAG: hypothetical protein L0219_21760 [Phycisphaerales bacterium]|nr:hypothetical protein [Phycisphaerales bacterium]
MKAYSLPVVVIAALSIIFVGCARQATYPPVEVTAKLVKPTSEPIPSVMAAAIRYAREMYVKGQDMAINLPAGMPAEVYERVFGKIGGGRPMTSAGEKAIHIQEVRTRSSDAQVDLIYPRQDGFNQFVTLTLHRELLSSFRVKSAKAWQLRDVKTPEPGYVAPAPESETERATEIAGDATLTAAIPH